MRVLVIGAGRIGAKVLLQLQKNPSLTVFTVDPREKPFAVEEGIIRHIDHRSELNPGELKEVLRQVKPDLALVTTSAEDISRTGVSGLEVLVEALRAELESSTNVPIIPVARSNQ